MRGRLLFFGLLLLAWFPPTAASADLRSATWRETSKYVLQESDPTLPSVKAVDLRFDNELGDLAVSLRFVSPLPLPSSPDDDDRFEIDLGTQFVSDFGYANCSFWKSVRHAELRIPILGALPIDAVIFPQSRSFPSGEPLSGTTVTYNASRTQLNVHLASPALAGLGPVCWSGSAEDLSDYPAIDDRPLVGFTGLDGDVRAAAEERLAAEVGSINNLTVPKPLRGPDRFRRADRQRSRCDAIVEHASSCAVTLPLRDVRGVPTLHLSGSSTVFVYASGDRKGALGVKPSYRGRVHWHACPRWLDPARHGKACELPLSWTRGGLLGTFLAALDQRRRAR